MKKNRNNQQKIDVQMTEKKKHTKKTEEIMTSNNQPIPIGYFCRLRILYEQMQHTYSQYKIYMPLHKIDSSQSLVL